MHDPTNKFYQGYTEQSSSVQPSYFDLGKILQKIMGTGDILPTPNNLDYFDGKSSTPLDLHYGSQVSAYSEGDEESQYSKKPSTFDFKKTAGIASSAIDTTSSALRGDAITSQGENIARSGLSVIAKSGIPYASWIASGLGVGMDALTHFGKETSELNGLSNEDKSFLGNSYTGSLDAFSKAENVAGNKYSIFNRKGLNEANIAINEANSQKPVLDKVIANSQKQLEKQAGNTGMMKVRNNQRMYGSPSSKLVLAKEGTKLEESKFSIKESFIITEEDIPEFKTGGKMNVIPEGAFHCRKNNMEVEGITKKGIPVVLNEEGGEIEQQAEIERNEIIFNKEVTTKLEELYKDGSDEAAIKAGKILVEEILYNTDDRTGLIDSIEYHQQGGSIGTPQQVQQHLYIDPENGRIIDLGTAYGQKGFEYYTKLADEYKKPENPHWLNWAKQTVNPADYKNRDYIRENLPEGYNIDDNGIITDKDGNIYVTHRYGWAKEGNNLPSYKHLEGINPISVKWRKEHGNLPTNATFYPIYSPHSRYIEQKPEYIVTPEIAKQEKDRAVQNYIKDNSKEYYEMTLFDSPYVRDVFAEYEAFKQNPDEYIAIPYNGNYSSYIDGGSKQIFFDRETYLNKMKSILDKIDKIDYRMSNTYSDVAPLKDKDSPILQLTEEQLNKIKKEVFDPNYLKLERYYGETPEDLTEEFNNYFNRIKSKPIRYTPTQQEAEQNSQIRFQYLDSEGNPVFYQQGGTLDSGSKENFVKPTFERWYVSIPENAKASNYDYELAYNDLPLEELLNHAKDPSKYHLRSVGKENKEGLIPFLKLGKLTENPELNGEFEWYYSENPEAVEFRNNYDVIYKDGRYYYKNKQIK